MKIRTLAAWLAAPALLASLGCNTVPSVSDTDGTFHDSLRTYAKLVRWGEIERAGRFVSPDLRADFLALEEDLERLRFTDFDVGPVRYGEGGAFARVKVVYHVYDVATLVEQRIVDQQVWTEVTRTSWTVRPDLAVFQKVLGIEPTPAPQAAVVTDEPNG